MKKATGLAAPPKTRSRIDYERLTKLYNELEVSKRTPDPYIEMDQVYNATLFKKMIANRGLVPGVDFDVRDRRPFTYLIKKTNKKMNDQE